MDPKYSNIFWHQGVKVFAEDFVANPASRSRIEHLENDVTKAFINLFEHCHRTVLKEFLSMLGVKDHADSFEFGFQIRDTAKYRNHQSRIMLSIIGASCNELSVPG
jgi:hypothetical protein